MIRASVVVPTYERPRLLGRCLAALVAQDFDPREYEILVADDAASDATRAQVDRAALASRVPIRYLPVIGRHGPAAARNVGWHAAGGAIVAFTDDDCEPSPRWLAIGVEACSREGASATAGRVVVPLPDDPTDYERDAAGLEGAEFVTANCFLRREALEALGGFDERFSSAWREDSDLHFALIGSGRSIARAPEAVVVHPVRPAPWGVSLRQQRKSLYDALLFKKHPDLYRSKIRSAPPWDYYAIVASLGAAVMSAGMGQSRITLVSAIVWTVLTARFCARRLARTSRSPKHVAEMVATSALIPPLSVFWRLYGAWKFRVPFA